MIELFIPGEYEKDGVRRVAPGSLGHHPSYWSPVQNEQLRAPDALKAMYARVTKWIRQRYALVYGGPRKHFLGPAAHRAIQEGSLLLGGAFETREPRWPLGEKVIEQRLRVGRNPGDCGIAS